MHDSATHALDDFLLHYESRQAEAPGQSPNDAEASRLQQWVRAHPEAALRLVREAQATQAQLQAVRRERIREERARRMGVVEPLSQQALRQQSQAWDRLLGTRNGHRVQAAAGAGAGPAAAAKRHTIEDMGARFAHAHVGKAWIALGIVTVLVVALR